MSPKPKIIVTPSQLEESCLEEPSRLPVCSERVFYRGGDSAKGIRKVDQW